MFRGPYFIVSTMQEETTPIFKRLWYDWTQQQPGIEPTNPLGQCWVPPIVAFYDQQGLLRTYSLPGSSIRSPHPGSPRAGEEAAARIAKEKGEKVDGFSDKITGPGYWKCNTSVLEDLNFGVRGPLWEDLSREPHKDFIW